MKTTETQLPSPLPAVWHAPANGFADGVPVECEIVAERTFMGRRELCIRPRGLEGTKWVYADRVSRERKEGQTL